MLSAAKHLSAPRDRPFASLRVTIERSIRDLIRSPHTSDGLASVKLLAHLVLVTGEMACQIAFYKRRMHSAWADGVAANPLRDEIDGNRARQCQYSPFARAIGQTPIDTDGGCNRGHVDDHAPDRRLCQHLPHPFACAEEDAAGIHAHQALPVLQAGLQDSANVADAGIVDQDIKPTFGSSNQLYRGFDLGLFSHIKLLRACTPPGG